MGLPSRPGAGRILIAGCGWLGTALGLRLVAGGTEVWGLRRRTRELPDSFHPLAGDLGHAPSFPPLPTDLDGVVYAAAADGFSEAAYRTAYVEGPRNLLEALASSGGIPARVLFTSSTSVYGQTDGSWVDEDSPTEPSHVTGRLLLEGEAAVREAAPRATVVRLGGLYGPGRTRLLDSVREGRASLGEGPPVYTNRIHRDDAAGALAHLLAHPSPPDVLVGVDHDPADRNDVVGWLAGRLGMPAPAKSENGVSVESRALRSNKRCRNRRLVETGYAFRYPTFREGYEALLEDDRDHGDRTRREGRTAR